MERKLLESTPHEGLKNGTHIDAEVYYSKGGSNFLSGGTTPRGYYLNVKPVTHKDNTVSYVLFCGESKLLMETKRFSAKQFEQAVKMGKEAAPALIQRVLEKERAA